MKSGVLSDPEGITAVLDRFDAVQAEVASLSFDALTAPQALTVKDRLEMVSRRQAAVDHRLTHQLSSQASPVELGGTSWPTYCPTGYASAAARPAAASMKPTIWGRAPP